LLRGNHFAQNEHKLAFLLQLLVELESNEIEARTIDDPKLCNLLGS
jgi:hypothetical protein